MLQKCVASRVPILVCEYDSAHWFVCPSCHNGIEIEYVTNCSCCGQSLSWYGTMSQAHPLGEKPPTKKQRVVKERIDRKPELQSEINFLQEQLREKRAALRKIEEFEEEKEYQRLLKALEHSGVSVESLIEMLEA